MRVIKWSSMKSMQHRPGMTVFEVGSVVMRTIAAAFFLLGLSMNTVTALELRFGLAVAPTTVDPHHHNSVANNEVRRHVFESLTGIDERGGLRPLLATSWQSVDQTTWSFTLRQGVKFHDGSPFTVKDVVYTACRIANMVDGPSPFTLFTGRIANILSSSPLDVTIKTVGPHPQLPAELSTWGILSATANGVAGDIMYSPDGCTGIAEYPVREDFEKRGKSVGTGPFKLTKFVAEDRIVMDRNESYWGPQAYWTGLNFRLLPNDAMRVGALLAGEVDFISEPSSTTIRRLERHGGVNLGPGQSVRTVFLQFDHAQEPSPGISSAGGRNPFRDLRVRMAVAAAIDRTALGAATRDGVAMQASSLMEDGYWQAYAEDENHNPDRARTLLAAAGYSGGFELVLATPSGQFSQRGSVARAIARMLSDVGIRTKVDIVDAREFFVRRSRGEFSLSLGEWAPETADLSVPVRAVLATRDPNRGFGGGNWGGYSNLTLDRLIDRAMATNDVNLRTATFEKAAAVAMADQAIVPLYHEGTSWAYRWGLAYDLQVGKVNVADRVVDCIPCHALPAPPGWSWGASGWQHLVGR